MHKLNTKFWEMIQRNAVDKLIESASKLSSKIQIKQYISFGSGSILHPELGGRV